MEFPGLEAMTDGVSTQAEKCRSLIRGDTRGGLGQAWGPFQLFSGCPCTHLLLISQPLASPLRALIGLNPKRYLEEDSLCHVWMQEVVICRIACTFWMPGEGWPGHSLIINSSLSWPHPSQGSNWMFKESQQAPGDLSLFLMVGPQGHHQREGRIRTWVLPIEGRESELSVLVYNHPEGGPQ